MEGLRLFACALLGLGKVREAGYTAPMTNTTQRMVVSADMEGRRLDQALELLLPGSGLRERKRAWETGCVLVDGRPRPKGYRVMAGQTLELLPQGQDGSLQGETALPGVVPDGVRVVGQNTGSMAALFKPAGVHSEAIAGRPGLSVAGCLESFWPGRYAQLVNRLDFLTSGLLGVALCEETAEAYRTYEDQARVTKVYAALVRGRVEQSFTCSGLIDAARRRTVCVLDEPDPTGLRNTEVEPVLFEEGSGASLLRCTIHKGARHQIRAHLAAAGHPVLGDPLYGGPDEVGAERLYLHHFRLSLPGFEASAPPVWPLWAGWELPNSRF